VLLLTGSTGFLGRSLVPTLDLERYRIWVLSSDPARARQLFDERVERCFAAGDFSGAGIPWGSVDLLLHAGFARPYRPQREIAGSLAYTQKLFGLASRLEIPGVIYISSQSVYGQAADPPWQESAPLAPESPYAAAKYAGELMLERIRGEKPHLRTAAVRLAGLTGGQPGLVGVDLVSRFVKQALEGVPLEIQGEHVFERLDVRDAVNGLRALLRVPRADWQAVYNLGSGSSFSIRELARTVVEQVSRFTGEPPVEVELDLRDRPLKFEMDSSRFFRQTGWKPEYTLSDTIQSLIRYHLER
jgi:nucleoside-diphosphate-sugar epimerase